MSQQPFSRPGAIDLSALKKRPAPAGPGAGRPAAPGAPAGGAGEPAGGGSAYSVAVDESNFQSVLEASMTAPVVLVFHSPSQSPESTQLAADVITVADEYDGRFLAATIDVDAVPQIAQAMQIPQVPLMLVILDGRPATQPIPGAAPIEDIRALFNQLAQQLTAQGIAGHHAPHAFGGAAAATTEGEEPEIDPRYAPAQDALADGDIDRAVAEYQKLVDANPADHEAAAGLAMAKVLQRTQGVDLNAARAAAAAAPDDVDAQTMVADLDMLGGHVEDAFARLVELVRRTAGKDRDRAREHLVGLFAAVGNDDPRVLKGRQALASALF
ncbi:tetratricopeptide repeat protein [Nocardioides sp. zg-536]|uniref:Tetratricopeptide repeat protein n=1 Tax=Nocardioides faecalis TaxID=2803858 RepID=A0A938YAE3_9ACTN|nr:tetratricopeptide repeat protein [Nocardioides faecalis]MBM9460386.1 tetratricopeptide repeat protein [Nocardioides faecalis]QVI59787.1 tetratricopeptide repeat protein [Nocardioides faecalis]